MTSEDLIEVKTPPIVKPKPPSATSIPATLKTMQDEWDALMLHSFTQKQQLQTARQELSHSLYQHDSACRVIARLNKDIAQAREALATLKPQTGIITSAPKPAIASEASGMATQPIEQAGMSAEVIEKLQDKATVLTQERKKRGRTVPEELVTQDQLKTFLTTASHPVSIFVLFHTMGVIADVAPLLFIISYSWLRNSADCSHWYVGMPVLMMHHIVKPCPYSVRIKEVG